jgi:uncharacterized protein YrrD
MSLPDDLGTPSSYLMLEEGTPVFSGDGEELGRVAEVLADTGTDTFDGVVIATGPLGRDRRYVEAARVEEIYERGVVLTLDAADARELPPREGAAGGP